MVFLWWCFCGGDFVVVFLWWCFCGGVFVVVFLWWCFCGGIFVAMFLWWCFCGGVVVFLWWCFCGLAPEHLPPTAANSMGTAPSADSSPQSRSPTSTPNSCK